MGLQRVGHDWVTELKPSLNNFVHYLASMWNECDCVVVWTVFGTAFLGMKTDHFQSRDHCWVFQICWYIECSTFIASSFRIWNNSAGVLSPPLALFVVMLPKASPWLHIPGYQALGEWSHHCDYRGHEDLYLYSSSVYSCLLFLIYSASVRSIPFLYFI